jgi:hypothetical protein
VQSGQDAASAKETQQEIEDTQAIYVAEADRLPKELANPGSS